MEAIDNAGNITQSTHTWNVGYDSSYPTTAISATPNVPDGTNSWYLTDPTITLTASDPNTGTNSGIQSTVYKWGVAADLSNANFLDSGTTAYTAPFTMSSTVGDGDHYLYFRSTDNAGNKETILSLSLIHI